MTHWLTWSGEWLKNGFPGLMRAAAAAWWCCRCVPAGPAPCIAVCDGAVLANIAEPRPAKLAGPPCIGTGKTPLDTAGLKWWDGRFKGPNLGISPLGVECWFGERWGRVLGERGERFSRFGLRGLNLLGDLSSSRCRGWNPTLWIDPELRLLSTLLHRSSSLIDLDLVLSGVDLQLGARSTPGVTRSLGLKLDRYTDPRRRSRPWISALYCFCTLSSRAVCSGLTRTGAGFFLRGARSWDNRDAMLKEPSLLLVVMLGVARNSVLTGYSLHWDSTNTSTAP